MVTLEYKTIIIAVLMVTSGLKNSRNYWNHYCFTAITYNMWGLELKHNLATQALMLKLGLLKMVTTVQRCLAFWAFNRPYYICWVRHVLTLAIFPTPQSLAKVAQKIDEGMDVPRRLIGVLGICYPQSAVPCEVGVWRKD
jgi:hypothetical protein